MERSVVRDRPERIYSNQGNAPLVALLPERCERVLDVGCGAGDNAPLIAARCGKPHIVGITFSSSEAALARTRLSQCFEFDIEGPMPDYIANQSFDVLIFSHVLEHLREPEVVLARFLRLLEPGGSVLIAVPNTLSWRMRIRFLRGDFSYESAGELDDTHLRFFTYDTADKYLLSKSPQLKITRKTVSGSVPLWLLRRYVLSKNWAQKLDEWGCARWPNLFGSQVLISAVKQ